MNPDINRLEHILRGIARVEEKLNISYEDFIDNQDKKDILFANFAMIGEAAARISDELRKANPEVSWKRAIAIYWFIIIWLLITVLFGIRQRMICRA